MRRHSRRLVVSLAIVALSGTVGIAGARSAVPGCEGEQANPADDLQAVLDRSPKGATVCLAPGLYRPGAPLRPREGQTLIGSSSVVISGAKVVEGFVAEGPDFVATAFLPAAPSTHGPCIAAGCTITQDVYLDGAPLVRALARQELGPGRFFQDFTQNKLYLRDDPAGRLVEQAFLPMVFEPSSPGVVLSDFIVEKAASEAQRGAVTGEDGWTIEHLEVRFNHGVGIRCSNSCLVRANHVHHNGQMGLAGSGGTDDLFEANEVAFNNTAGYDPAWEAGGGKWTVLRGLVLRKNYVHDNRGAGLWTDINTEDVTFTGNYVSGNSHMGIFHEISYAATISGNTALANGLDAAVDGDGWGGAGIRVAASPRVKVIGNFVAGNRNGIMAIQQDRQDSPDPRGPHRIQDLEVRGNRISMDRGVTGLLQDIGDQGLFSAHGNVFDENRYHLDSFASPRFAWNDRIYPAEDWVRDGNDRKGAFETGAPPVPGPPEITVGPRPR